MAIGGILLEDSANEYLKLGDSVCLHIGDGANRHDESSYDVKLRWDGTDLDALAYADDSVIKFGDGTTSFDLWVYGDTSSDYILWDASANLLNLVGAAKLGTYRRGNITAKTADYSVVVADSGKLFTTRGAGGAVTFTLPAAGTAGCWYEFINLVDQTMTVAAATADTLITDGDLAADSVAYSTTSHKVGGHCVAIDDGTSYIVYNLCDNALTIAT